MIKVMKNDWRIMLMKLLHTADLHIDRAFEGLKDMPIEVAHQLQQANQKVLERIIDVAIQSEVDAVVFAGDTFHQSRTSIRTQAYFIKALKRLEQAQIPVIITFGNHDYYVAERYWFDFPKNVHIFDKEQVKTHYFVTKHQEKVAISGFSYEHSWINENKLNEFPQKDSTVDLHLGIYHGDTSNQHDAQNYAPFSFSEMKQKNYDYWALGHIHQPQIVSAQPLIVYPGTPQGHTKKEVTAQGIALVNVGKGHSTVHFQPVAQVGWQKKSYSLSNCQSLKESLQFLTKAILLEEINKADTILLEVHLQEVEHLGEEFQLSYRNGELLHYVQEEVLLRSNNTLFPFQLVVKEALMEKKALILADKELLHQLEKNYLQADIFSDVMKELTQNPAFSKAVKIDDYWRQKSLISADQQIKEDFDIKEGR